VTPRHVRMLLLVVTWIATNGEILVRSTHSQTIEMLIFERHNKSAKEI
jgi:hypothetical protein